MVRLFSLRECRSRGSRAHETRRPHMSDQNSYPMSGNHFFVFLCRNSPSLCRHLWVTKSLTSSSTSPTLFGQLHYQRSSCTQPMSRLRRLALSPHSKRESTTSLDSFASLPVTSITARLTTLWLALLSHRPPWGPSFNQRPLSLRQQPFSRPEKRGSFQGISFG